MIFRIVLVSVLFVMPAVLCARETTGQPAIRVESVQADFVQEKQLPILARPIFSTGRFLFKAPGSLRWEYFSPVRTVLIMHDGQVRKFIQHDGKFREEHGMGLDAMQVVLQEITGWLKGAITDTPTFRASVEGDGRIVLTPRETALEKIISRIELQLHGQAGLMESVTLHEGEDSFTRMEFSGAVLNETIDPERFVVP